MAIFIYFNPLRGLALQSCCARCQHAAGLPSFARTNLCALIGAAGIASTAGNLKSSLFGFHFNFDKDEFEVVGIYDVVLDTNLAAIGDTGGEIGVILAFGTFYQ